MLITIRKGLNLPIPGQPEQTIHLSASVRSVALIGLDYIDLKPTMMVSEGDRVKLGQPLFSDKKNPRVLFTAPGGGTVRAIHRGQRRMLQSVEIELDNHEEAIRFDAFNSDQLDTLPREQVIERLLTSGLWTALRSRPFSKIPHPDTTPEAIFVTAIDTQPLAVDPAVVINDRAEAFSAGMRVLARLTDGPLHVCTAPEAQLPALDANRCQISTFEGPHPAGLVGTHIHYLHPVSIDHMVWHLGYQDVIAMGHLFTHGEIDTSRVVALAGPVVKQPRLVRTRLGASLDQLVEGELDDLECRVIAGSVLSGRQALGWSSFLGRYHSQVSVLREARERPFLGWVDPRSKRFSLFNILLSALHRKNSQYQHDFSTSQNGSLRAMVPVGNYERVVPLDMLPTQLLRALVVGDTESAQQLGCLELDEEDLALCSYVCVGKYDYGPVLRKNLHQIEREG